MNTELLISDKYVPGISGVPGVPDVPGVAMRCFFCDYAKAYKQGRTRKGVQRFQFALQRQYLREVSASTNGDFAPVPQLFEAQSDIVS